MNQVEFDKIYGKKHLPDKLSIVRKKISRRIASPKWFQKRLLRLVPILAWLPNYDWKNDCVCDLIAGLVVGIMLVPQAMAYATLAGVEPIYGLYSSFFPSMIYMFLGTSRHISVGTFAVASMMVGAVRYKLLPDQPDSTDVLNSTTTAVLDSAYANVDLMTFMSTLTLAVGLIQLVMGVFRLSFLTTYISDQVISGFTTATAVHVFTSQVNKILGVPMPKHSGYGMIPLIWRDLIASLPQVNLMTLGLSVFGICFLYLGKEYINPIVKRKSPVPIPFELILVILNIIFSTQMQVKKNFNVVIVNNIPRGLPSASLPRFDLLPGLLIDAIPIAIICYMFVISLGKLFARKHGYKLDPTQELFALGIAEIISSLFPVYPAGCALSRSFVCESSGVKTQLYNVISGTLLLGVIIWLGPLLEPLPMCILSCIVIVALKSLFLQVTQLPKLWQVSKYDFAVWIVSFLATLFTTVTLGLFISLGFVIVTVLLRQQWSKIKVLGADPSKTVFASRQRYSKLDNVSENVLVVRFESPLYFANAVNFADGFTDIFEGKSDKLEEVVVEPSNVPKKCVIVDCSAITFIDTMGLDAILQTYKTAQENQVQLLFAACSETVIDTLQKTGAFETIDPSLFFPTVSEALSSIEHQ